MLAVIAAMDAAPNGHGWWVDTCDVELDDETDDEPFDFNEDEFNKLVFGEDIAHRD